MLLSVEYRREEDELDIVCDSEGLNSLIDRLVKLRDRGGHTHLMTPSWAGDELTEERQTDNGVLVNHVRIVLLHKDATG
ncbi:MAG: Imm32 family immunity protein [Planctomycetota bacterium]